MNPVSGEPRCEDAHPSTLSQRNTAQNREDGRLKSRTHIKWVSKFHPRNGTFGEIGPSGLKKPAEFPKPVFIQQAGASATPRNRGDEQNKRMEPEHPSTSGL